jgi:hypothetical protein
VCLLQKLNFLATDWNGMTHRQALQGFPTQVKNRSVKQFNQLTSFIALPAGNREVTVPFNFISEHAVFLVSNVRAM